MNEKFLGVGLKNVIGIAVFTMLFLITTKVIFTQHYVEGVSEVVKTA